MACFYQNGKTTNFFRENKWINFFKPLGTGSGNGFSIKPDFSTFGFIAVFDTEQQAKNFTSSTAIERYKQTALNFSVVFMKNIKTHGA